MLPRGRNKSKEKYIMLHKAACSQKKKRAFDEFDLPFLSRIVFAFQLLISDRDTHFLFIQTVIKIFINISCEPHILRDELYNQRMHYIVLRLIIDKYISICNIFLPLNKNFQTRFRL